MQKLLRPLTVFVIAALWLPASPLRVVPAHATSGEVRPLAVMATPAPAPAAQSDAAVPFSSQIVIADNVMGAHSVASVDFDRDGRIDIVSASREDGRVVWHRNVGNLNFRQINLAQAGGSYVALPVDLNRDGYTDVLVTAVGALDPSAAEAGAAAETFGEKESAVVSEIGGANEPEIVGEIEAEAGDEAGTMVENASAPTAGGGSVFWLRNNLADKVIQFTRFDIGFDLSYPVSVHAADIDSDGDIDVLATTRDGNQVLLYENNGEAGVPTFSLRVIDGELSGAVFVTTGDIDGDGKLDLLAAGENNNQIVWYRNAGNRPATFERRFIRNGPVPDPRYDYAKTIAVGDLDGDGDLDIAFGSENENLVGWYENQGRGASFTPQTLTTTADHVKMVTVADINRDGALDILGVSSDDNTVLMFENRGGRPATFIRKVVTSSALGARGVHAADFDRDGDLDVVVASRVDNRIVLHFNNSIHRSALLESERVVNTYRQTRSVAAADIDGDGRMDMLSTANEVVAWHRNLGGSPPNFESIVIDASFTGGRWVTSGDIDHDGDIDVIAADRGTDRIMLYENQLRQTGAASFAERIVAMGAANVRDVNVADIDGDGDLDLYSASDGDGTIAWYENLDRVGRSWSKQIVGRGLGYPRSSYAADLDGDGRLDLMSASANDNRVTIYRQVSPKTFTQETIYDRAQGAQFIHSADIDKDGDMDIVVSSERDHTVSWFANRLNANLGFQRYVVSSTAYGVHAAIAADMDGDGDLDTVAAVEYSNQIVWYENLGGVIPTWQEHLISPFAQIAHGVFVADLDGDGDTDVISASRGDGKVAWYENRGGQFRLTQTTANATLGAQRVLLDAVISHRGRAGNPVLQLDSFTLRLENESGQRLTSEQVGDLYSALLVYQDNGDGRYNPATDPLIWRETLFLLNNGELLLDLPRPATPPGGSNRYFVVAEQRQAQCNYGAISASIVVNGRTAVDGVTGVPLLGEYMRSLADANDPSLNRKPPIVINELMADNRTTLVDPDEPLEYPDWFELHNLSNLAINLGGMYLTDDPSNLRQYRIPDNVVIGPRGYLLFIADGEPEQGPLHTPFNLNRGGETLVLYDIDVRGNQAIDQVTFGAQQTDVSWGRSPFDSSSWITFDIPSPGRHNMTFTPTSFVFLPSVASGGETCR